MSKSERESKAARLHLLILVICACLGGVAATFRQLLDEADEDVARARLRGFREGHYAKWHTRRGH